MWFPLFILVLPVAGGIIGSRYLGAIANFIVMMVLFNFGLTVTVLMNSGEFHPLLLIPGVGIFPHVGRFSGVSLGGLVYPPLFLLVAVVCKRRRSQP
jgi:hypothetical protein